MEVKKDMKTAGLLRRGSTSRRAKGTARPIQTLVYLGERKRGEERVWGFEFQEEELQNQGEFIV